MHALSQRQVNYLKSALLLHAWQAKLSKRQGRQRRHHELSWEEVDDTRSVGRPPVPLEHSHCTMSGHTASSRDSAHRLGLSLDPERYLWATIDSAARAQQMQSHGKEVSDLLSRSTHLDRPSAAESSLDAISNPSATSATPPEPKPHTLNNSVACRS